MPSPFISVDIGSLGPKKLLPQKILWRAYEEACSTTLLEQGLLAALKESEN